MKQYTYTGDSGVLNWSAGFIRLESGVLPDM